MFRIIQIITLFLLLLLAISLVAEESFRDSIMSLHKNSSISSDSLYILYKNRAEYCAPEKTGELIREFNTINDTLNVPFIYYLPEGYITEQKTPVLVNLHGGVSRPEFLSSYYEDLQQSPFLEIAEDNNWIILFPMANIHTTWWSETGIENIQYQLRHLKERYNVDDDRIYITGFSDGGSGSYHLAMFYPQDFAVFYPLCGNMVVGSIVTGMPAYTSNMINRYLRAVNTDLDGLYPAARMRMLVETAQDMGANIFYIEYWGIGHTYEFAPYDLPLMTADMIKQARNIFQPYLYWETSDTRWGRCDWIEITGIDTLHSPQDWQYHKTLLLPEDRIMFGFMDDGEYQGQGVRIGSIVENSVSEEIGLSSGDIIIAMDQKRTDDISELLRIRDSKKRGDTFELTVIREGAEIFLKGAFPPVTYQEIFNYGNISGALKATYRANSFYLETSRVSQIAVYIHPAMVNLQNPVKIVVNDTELFNELVGIDREFLTTNYIENRDRSALWVKRIVLKIP